MLLPLSFGDVLERYPFYTFISKCDVYGIQVFRYLYVLYGGQFFLRESFFAFLPKHQGDEYLFFFHVAFSHDESAFVAHRM